MSLETLLTTIATNQDLGADFVTGGVDVSQYLGYMLQMNFDFSDMGDSTGSMFLEVSVDNVNWTLYIGSTQNFDNTSTASSWEIEVKYHKYVRVNVTNSGGSGGLATILGFFTREVK